MAQPSHPSQASQGYAWQWQERAQWQDYAAQHNKVIETAFRSGLPSLSLRMGAGAYHVDLREMLQTNVQSSFQRPMRRLSPPDEPVQENWFYEDGGMWVSYPAEACAFLTLAKSLGITHTTLHTPRWYSYEIDFQTNKQRNIHTNTQRDICVEANGNVNKTSQPDASSSGQMPSSTHPQVAAAAPVPNQQISSAVHDSANEMKVADTHTGNSNDIPELELGDPSDPVFAVVNQATHFKDTTAQDQCSICLGPFGGDDIALHLPHCGEHYFHRDCIVAALRATSKCPNCNYMYCTLEGTQPRNGTMSVHLQTSVQCDGFQQYGTWEIRYHFPSGVQTEEHPNPGVRYEGTSRVAYLPDTPEGREVLEMLKTCFERRLTFTVGTSVTTGIENSVVWNGVHHKTNTHGGSARFGFPDATYFDRVKLELHAKGVGR